jgi:hypothetical protein
VSTRCSICRHLARADIDAALAGGMSASQVARDFGVHRSSVVRHQHTHLVVALARVIDRDNNMSKAAILDNASQLYGYCEALLDRAEEIVQRHPERPRAIIATAAVIREARATLAMVANTIAATTPTHATAATEPGQRPGDLSARIAQRLRHENIMRHFSLVMRPGAAA